MTSGTWQQVVRVALSILIIVGVAVAQAHSKTLAAITASMPLTMSLALWIVYSGSSGDQATVMRFIEALLITMVANIFYAGAMWLAARAGWRLLSLLVVGYLAWGAALGLIMGLRHLLGGS